MPRLAKSVAAKTLVWDHLTLNPSSSAAYGEGDRETEREREGKHVREQTSVRAREQASM